MVDSAILSSVTGNVCQWLIILAKLLLVATIRHNLILFRMFNVKRRRMNTLACQCMSLTVDPHGCSTVMLNGPKPRGRGRSQSYEFEAEAKANWKKYRTMINNIRFKVIAEKINKIPEFYTIFARKMPDYIMRQRDRGQAETKCLRPRARPKFWPRGHFVFDDCFIQP